MMAIFCKAHESLLENVWFFSVQGWIDILAVAVLLGRPARSPMSPPSQHSMTKYTCFSSWQLEPPGQGEENRSENQIGAASEDTLWKAVGCPMFENNDT